MHILSIYKCEQSFFFIQLLTKWREFLLNLDYANVWHKNKKGDLRGRKWTPCWGRCYKLVSAICGITTGQLPELCPLAYNFCEVKPPKKTKRKKSRIASLISHKFNAKLKRRWRHKILYVAELGTFTTNYTPLAFDVDQQQLTFSQKS